MPLAFVAIVASHFGGLAETTTIYSTGFERAEGFDARLTLMGQDGWTGTDTNGNGNGIVSNFFVNTTPQQPFGEQQAFVGFYPLTRADGILNVWRPLGADPVASGDSIVTFSTTMAIYDSVTNTNRDCFRWSVYNMVGNGVRLFTLDFDNTTREINYELDDGVFVPTGFLFQREGEYDLVVTMNFADNLWSATFQGSDATPTVIVDSQPMTTEGSVLNLGDIDAVWVSREIGRYGDNYMVFDNYSVTAEPYPFWLDVAPRAADGAFTLRLTGEPERNYSIDVTTDFVDWYALKTNSAGANGSFDFVDRTATNYPYSFYRARLVP
jgi:hypothetical protein